MRITTPRGPLVVWRPPGSRGRAVVVYVHGLYDTIDSAIAKHKLLEQFAASGVDATFVIPETRSAGGKFESLTELLELAGVANTNHVTAIAHSGGNVDLRLWIDEGDPRLINMIMLDALYGGYSKFKRWGSAPGRWMVLVGQDTRRESKRLAGELGAPYFDAKSHMGIVTEGKWIPRLLAAAPIPQPSPIVAIAIAGALGYLLYRYARS